jgi:predicted enzyme related to lactoylglutathione lyase
MSEPESHPAWSLRETYPPGVPCWVEALQPDADAALDFYGPLFGWSFDDPTPMPGVPGGHHFVARVGGRAVAGIGSLAEGTGFSAPAWTTHIRVDSADEVTARAKDAGGTVRVGPLEALPAGRLAVLADPAGARFCVWEAHGREGAQLINEPRAWDLSSLRTTDLGGSAAFYAAVFGWRSEAFGLDGRLTLWRLPGYVGGQPQQPVPRDVVAIMTPLGGPSSAGKQYAHWSVDFYCEDADATAERAARLGGAVIVPPYDGPGFRGAVLEDPQGATFSVSQQITG